MSRYLLLPLVLGAIACETPAEPYASDVFWIQIFDEGTVCPDTEITHNYNAFLSSTESVFDVSSVTTESTGGEYGYVTRGEDGSIFLNFRGEVLTGTQNDNGSIEVSWTNEETSTTTITEDTFESVFTVEETVEQTMSLRPNNNEDNPTYSGAYTRRDYALIELEETDEWSFQKLGVGTQYDTSNYLEWFEDPPGQGNGEARNYSYLDDCLDADKCMFRLLEDCTRQFTVEAVKLEGADINTFGAINDFDQPNGVQ